MRGVDAVEAARRRARRSLAWRRADRRRTAAASPPQVVAYVGRLRSGTTVLRALLDGHPALRCHGEIFNADEPDSVYWHLRRRARLDPDLVMPGPRLREIERFIDNTAHQAVLAKPTVRYALYDFKVETFQHVHHHWHAGGITNPTPYWFVWRGWPVLWLRRPNHLERWVSMLNAQASHMHHLPVGEARAGDRRAEAGDAADRLVDLFDAWEAQDRALGAVLETSPRLLTLQYDELFAGGEWSPDVVAALAAFFEIDEAGFERRPALAKINPTRWRDALVDPDRVEGVLAGTAYEHLLGA